MMPSGFPQNPQDLSGIFTILQMFLFVLPFIILFFIFKVRFIRRIFVWVLGLFPAALLFIIGILAIPLWPLARWLARVLPGAKRFPRFFEGLVKRYGEGAAPLTKGDREGFAKAIWPEERYPFLYQPVPEDIKRPLWTDGKLPEGVDLPYLADRHFTRGLIKTAAEAALSVALLFVLIPVVLFLYQFLTSSVAGLIYALDATPPILESWPDGDRIEASIWEKALLILGNSFGHLFLFIIYGVFYFAFWILLGAGVAICVALMVVEQWRRRKAGPYELISKDAHVRWPYRAEQRALANATYAQQTALSNGYLKDTPIFKLGEGTGTFRVRGDLAAPMTGQTVALDGDSLFQHLMIFGGTGEGKTTAILKPLLRQFLASPKYGLFVCDAKGVLWNDAADLAKQSGREDDLVIVGTGEGQFGIDPFSSLTPTQITSVMRSVLKQLNPGSGSGDSFWPDMASSLFQHALILGRAFKETEAGQALLHGDDEDALNPYSLWWAYRTLLDQEKLEAAIEAVRNHTNKLLSDIDSTMGDKKAQQKFIEAYDAIVTPELSSTLEYLEGAWRSMAENTRSGILASLTQLLDGFSGSPTLRRRFACGLPDETINIEEALNGKLVLNALSTVEDGLPARLVSIMIKTALYRQARVREAQMKAKGENPQDTPCIVLMDEVQEIVTVDPASGLSDASFWNVARSSGLAGIFATQTIAALNQAMGQESCANFLQQARSKIFLRSEDKDTVDYACWCAGKYERNRVFEDAQKESIDHRTFIDGWSPFDPVDEDEVIPLESGTMLLWRAAAVMLGRNEKPIGNAKSAPTYVPDLRFVPAGSVPFGQNAQSADQARLSAMQQAFWRAEDKEQAYRTQGNQMEDALKPSDMMGMGRWYAYAHIQRAGAARQDIIELKHDFD